MDDVLLERAPQRWPDVATLLDRLASTAERAGGTLSFRIRHAFAEGDGEGFLRSLEHRGHEVGAHTHGSGLARVVTALRTRGVNPVVMAPGLVQVGDRGRRSLLAEAAALGATHITDRLETRWFAYQGWLAWQPVQGLTSLDVSVSPFSWGVLERRGRSVVPGTLDWNALTTLARRQRARRAPDGSTPFFGATFHEHDVCEPGTLRPRELDGFERFVVDFQPVRSGSIQIPPSAAPAADPITRNVPFVRRVALTLERRTHPTRDVEVGARRVRARRVGPDRPRAALVVIHGGESGVRQGLGFLGLRESAFPDLAVWTYARSESFRTPGNPVHVADARAVIAAARADGVSVAILTWSAGLIAGLRAADSMILGVIDVEGPADRWSLVPPGNAGHELAKLDPDDDAVWAGKEAITLVCPCPYVRVQGEIDHVHGRMTWHADRLVHAFSGERIDVPGAVASAPERAGAEIRRLLDQWLGTT